MTESKSLNRRKRVVFIFIYLLLLLLLIEGSLRLYFTVRHNAHFFNPSRMTTRAYSDVFDILDSPVESSNEFSILILGASVLYETFGHIPTLLEEKLQTKGVKNFRIYNVSQGAHTTLDSYLKHKILRNKSFDIIIIYHGINEVRANNCPTEIFRNDYSHYAWYELRYLDDRHTSTINISIIPYSVDFLFLRLKQKFLSPRYVPTHSPRAEWIKYGSQIKTSGPFKENIEKIIHESSGKKEIPIIMTYAYYLPENYSHKNFESKSLDYSFTDYSYPVKLWGSAENVVKGLQAHNSVIRELARTNPSVEYIDMEKIIPKEGEYFADICHLSGPGSDLFAETLANKISDIYERKEK